MNIHNRRTTQELLSAGRNLNLRIREAAGIFFHLKTIRFGKDFWQPVYVLEQSPDLNGPWLAATMIGPVSNPGTARIPPAGHTGWFARLHLNTFC